jgi:hypothetical protein
MTDFVNKVSKYNPNGLARRANLTVFLFDPSPLSRVPFIPVRQAAALTAETLPRTVCPEFRSTMVAGSFADLRVNFVLDHSPVPQRMGCNGTYGYFRQQRIPRLNTHRPASAANVPAAH